jgi:fused signal recognition particle receptor
MYKTYTSICVFLALLVMTLGVYLRVAMPELSCPDCPPSPEALSLYLQQAMGWGADWPNLAHRHLAGGAAVLVMGLLVWACWAPRRRVMAVILSILALLTVGVQIRLGLWVTAEAASYPFAVVVHYAVAILTLALVYGVRVSQSADEPLPAFGGWDIRWVARIGLLALVMQMLSGVWVSVNHAGLACADFPTCFSTYRPPVDYELGFHLRSPDAAATPLTVSAQAAIHWVHRVSALAVFVLLSGLAFSISSNPRTARLSKPGVWLSFLLLLQVGLGVVAVTMLLPPWIVVAHGLVAALLLLVVLHINLYLRAPNWLPETLEAPAVREALEQIPAEVAIPPVVVPREEPVPVRVEPENLFNRLKTGLGKTRGGLTGFLANLALGKKAIDRDLLEEIEGQLIMADIGVSATQEIIGDLTDSMERSELADADVLTQKLRDHLYTLLEPCSQPLVIPQSDKPFVILVVGVNGVGKTTTIGKLARRLQDQGHKVMLAAGDTFRAAAVEQLQTWGERNQIPVVAQSTGADSASVIFDGIQSAQAKGIDVLIADTAGRLHTKSNLMEELAKIKRIMAKLDPTAPHEVLLVLDSGTGQNAINQARQFNEAVGLTGLVLTKLDGTAKGGVIFNLAKQFGIPIRYIGVGEGIEDLQDFDARRFIEALFE